MRRHLIVLELLCMFNAKCPLFFSTNLPPPISDFPVSTEITGQCYHFHQRIFQSPSLTQYIDAALHTQHNRPYSRKTRRIHACSFPSSIRYSHQSTYMNCRSDNTHRVVEDNATRPRDDYMAFYKSSTTTGNCKEARLAYSPLVVGSTTSCTCSRDCFFFYFRL